MAWFTSKTFVNLASLRAAEGRFIVEDILPDQAEKRKVSPKWEFWGFAASLKTLPGAVIPGKVR